MCLAGLVVIGVLWSVCLVLKMILISKCFPVCQNFSDIPQTRAMSWGILSEENVRFFLTRWCSMKCIKQQVLFCVLDFSIKVFLFMAYDCGSVDQTVNSYSFYVLRMVRLKHNQCPFCVGFLYTFVAKFEPIFMSEITNKGRTLLFSTSIVNCSVGLRFLR